MCKTGRIHSIQSLGAVDGPGLRSVVFMQGCPLRCAYCHNPDTWEFGGGTEISAEELVHKLLRFKPYWGKDGGVTISGGEPLAQPEFTAQVFRLLRSQGVHTALDTSGNWSLSAAEMVLEQTDMALVDVKFLTEGEYARYCKGSFSRTLEFLELTKEKKIPVWIRHVAVPGLTAETSYLAEVKALADRFPNVQKLEYLPFHNLCLEKYERLGIPFPLADTPPLEKEQLDRLLKEIM